MARELKMHLESEEKYHALCGKNTERVTTDAEIVSCQSCSGIYRSNVIWYSKIRNKSLESKGGTGSDELYTRSDIEAGLMRLGWQPAAIDQLLDKTSIFRDVFLENEVEDAWADLKRKGRV